MSAGSSSTSRRVTRVRALQRKIVERQRRLERRLERRAPALYDARHALREVGRVLWPLVSPLLAMVVVVPLLVGLALLWHLLGLELPRVELPSIDLPDVSWPDVAVPAWVEAIGSVVGSLLALLVAAAKPLVLVLAVLLGVHRTRVVRRQRKAAESLGRQELLRRLAVGLTAVEAAARAQRAKTIGGVSLDDAQTT